MFVLTELTLAIQPPTHKNLNTNLVVLSLDNIISTSTGPLL